MPSYGGRFRGMGFKGRSGFAFKRPFGYKKPGLLTVNHCLGPTFATAAGVETQTVMFTGLDDPLDRNDDIPTGSVMKQVDVYYWATDATPVNGYHRCMMVFQPGATTYTNPIAAWLDATAGLTEEAIQVRQNVMSPFRMKYVVTGAPYPLMWHCRWKGSKVMRESDDIVLVLQDQNITNWAGYCVGRYVT